MTKIYEILSLIFAAALGGKVVEIDMERKQIEGGRLGTG
jgi:hypothetical protein